MYIYEKKICFEYPLMSLPIIFSQLIYSLCQSIHFYKDSRYYQNHYLMHALLIQYLKLTHYLNHLYILQNHLHNIHHHQYIHYYFDLIILKSTIFKLESIRKLFYFENPIKYTNFQVMFNFIRDFIKEFHCFCLIIIYRSRVNLLYLNQ